MLAGKELHETHHCFDHVSGGPYGFYGKPIFIDDGSILIPYSVTNHADSLVQELLVVHNNTPYSEELRNRSFLYLPAEDVGETPFSIEIGYTTSQRTKNGCLIFFSQPLFIHSRE